MTPLPLTDNLDKEALTAGIESFLEENGSHPAFACVGPFCPGTPLPASRSPACRPTAPSRSSQNRPTEGSDLGEPETGIEDDPLNAGSIVLHITFPN